MRQHHVPKTYVVIVSADLADALCVLDSTTNPWSKGARPRARPKFCRGPHELGQALVQEQSANEAIVEFWKAIALSGHSGAFDSNLAYAYAVSGQKDEATKILAESAATSYTNRSAANIALIYAGLGDNDQAMNWLEKAYDARFNPSILLRPAWDPLRSDARFKNLRRRIGLPQ